MAEDRPKRRYPRIHADNVVLVKRLEGPPVEGFTKIQVMGQGGCMIISDEPLGVDARLEILLSFSGRVVQARGRVAYENQRNPGEYEVGVQFLEVGPDDQEFLEQVLPGAD
jgi:hypothetical protein